MSTDLQKQGACPPTGAIGIAPPTDTSSANETTSLANQCAQLARILEKAGRREDLAVLDLGIPNSSACPSGNLPLVLGYEQNGTVVSLSDEELLGHAVLLGRTRHGLGAWVGAQQVARGGACIVMDSRPDTSQVDELSSSLAHAGRLADLQVVNLDDPNQSSTYNPLLSGTPEDVAARILLLRNASAKNDPLATPAGRKAAHNLLAAVVSAYRSAGQNCTFASLYVLFHVPGAMDEFIAKVPATGDAREGLQVALQPCRQGSQGLYDVDSLRGLLGSVADGIDQFSTGKLGAVVNDPHPEVDLAEVLRNQKVLYITGPVVSKNLVELAFGRLVVSDLEAVLTQLAKDGGLASGPTPLVVGLEFASSRPTEVAELLSKATKAKVALMLAYSDFSSLGLLTVRDVAVLARPSIAKVLFSVAGSDDPQMVDYFASAWAATSASPGEFLTQFERLRDATSEEGLVLNNRGSTLFDAWVAGQRVQD